MWDQEDYHYEANAHEDYIRELQYEHTDWVEIQAFNETMRNIKSNPPQEDLVF